MLDRRRPPTSGAGANSTALTTTQQSQSSQQQQQQPPQDFALLPVSLTKPQTIRAISNLATSRPASAGKRLAAVQTTLQKTEPLVAAGTGGANGSPSTRGQSRGGALATAGASIASGAALSCVVEIGVSCQRLPESALVSTGTHCAVGLHVLDQASYVTTFEFKGQTEPQKYVLCFTARFSLVID